LTTICGAFFFGQEASTNSRRDLLIGNFDNYIHKNTDIRSQPEMEKIFREYNSDISLVIHTCRAAFARLGGERPAYGFYG
jgi:hypothetical protein